MAGVYRTAFCPTNAWMARADFVTFADAGGAGDEARAWLAEEDKAGRVRGVTVSSKDGWGVFSREGHIP